MFPNDLYTTRSYENRYCRNFLNVSINIWRSYVYKCNISFTSKLSSNEIKIDIEGIFISAAGETGKSNAMIYILNQFTKEGYELPNIQFWAHMRSQISKPMPLRNWLFTNNVRDPFKYSLFQLEVRAGFRHFTAGF